MFNAAFSNLMLQNIKSDNIESALNQAELLGWLLWKNNLGIYSFRELEEYLSKQIEEKITSKNLTPSENPKEILFIATEMYLFGGHSRLAENLSTYIDNNADLLITKKSNDKVKSRESLYFKNIYTINCNKKNRIYEIEQIIKILLNYKKIIINTHPNDIISICACILAKKISPNIKFYFVNHADHVFNYGVAATDIWFEISNYGHQIDKKRQLICHRSFLGIPTKTKDVEIKYPKFQDGDLMISAGAMYKFKPIYEFSIMPLINALLKFYPHSKCQVIGVKKYRNYWWWPLKLKYRSRLILSETLSYEDYLTTTDKAKLYIDSQPYTGGTAFVEQFFTGKQCIGLTGYIWGYTPLDQIKQNSVADVIKYLNSDNYDFLNKVKKEAILIHDPENVKQRFLRALNNKFVQYEDIIPSKNNDDIIVRDDNCIRDYPKRLNIKNIKTLLILFRLSNLKLKIKLPIYYILSKFR